MAFVKERKCGTPGCADPVTCGERKQRKLQGYYLLSAWECHIPNTKFLTLKIPHNKSLLSKQSDDLNKKDIVEINKDREAGECLRQECHERKKCIAIRRIQRQPGITSYLLAPCVTTTQPPEVNSRPPTEHFQQTQGNQEPAPPP